MITPPEICPVPGTLLAVRRHLSLRERETNHGFRKRRTALAARRTIADYPAAGSVLASLMCATNLNLASARIRFGTCAPDMYLACERLRTIYFQQMKISQRGLMASTSSFGLNGFCRKRASRGRAGASRPDMTTTLRVGYFRLAYSASSMPDISPAS